MVTEQQALYPKGTYKILFTKLNGGTEYCIVNLSTGRQCCTRYIWNMIKSIEADLSANTFPQSAVLYRSWGEAIASQSSPTANEILHPNDTKSKTPLNLCNATFVLRVLFRQNATWQGTIQWIEGRQTRQYRSLNELLKLMDDALNLSQELPPVIN